MQLKALAFDSVQPRLAHGAVSSHMQLMALTLASVQPRLADGAVGSLMQLVALTFYLPCSHAWLTALSARLCS